MVPSSRVCAKQVCGHLLLPESGAQSPFDSESDATSTRSSCGSGSNHDHYLYSDGGKCPFVTRVGDHSSNSPDSLSSHCTKSVGSSQLHAVPASGPGATATSVGTPSPLGQSHSVQSISLPLELSAASTVTSTTATKHHHSNSWEVALRRMCEKTASSTSRSSHDNSDESALSTHSSAVSATELSKPVTRQRSLTWDATDKTTSAHTSRELKYGDTVVIAGGKFQSQRGIVRYVGAVRSASGTWIGVELYAPIAGQAGNTDGTHTYFHCKQGHGCLVKSTMVLPLDKQPGLDSPPKSPHSSGPAATAAQCHHSLFSKHCENEDTWQHALERMSAAVCPPGPDDTATDATPPIHLSFIGHSKSHGQQLLNDSVTDVNATTSTSHIRQIHHDNHGQPPTAGHGTKVANAIRSFAVRHPSHGKIHQIECMADAKHSEAKNAVMAPTLRAALRSKAASHPHSNLKATLHKELICMARAKSLGFKQCVNIGFPDHIPAHIDAPQHLPAPAATVHHQHKIVCKTASITPHNTINK
jgi:CAP-Gly domain